jgi:type II secretion system protein H
MSKDARNRGFTLIELMVVLVLIGIMTAMIIPEMRGTYEDAVLRSSSRELINVFNLAYSRAVTANQLQRVRFDLGNGSYVMEKHVRVGLGESGFAPVRDVPGGEGKIDSRISMELHRPGEGLSDGSDQGEQTASKDNSTTVRDEAIAFYPDGTADAGEILLQDRDGFRLALRINPITARVNIVELERRGP